MKKALIISYYFPPCHGSAPWRAYSWAKYFKSSGIEPVVITRHWHGNEHSWPDYIKDIDEPLKHEIFEDYEIYFLPSRKRPVYKFFTGNNLLKKIFRPFVYLFLQLRGIVNIEVDAYFSFKDFLNSHLTSYKYDFVIISLPPLNIVSLIPLIKKNSGAKIIVDFRDIWDNHILSATYKPSLKKQFFNSLNTFYIKKNLKEVDLVTVVTPSFVTPVKKIFAGPVEVIYNGFEEEYFGSIERKPNLKFRFSLIGSLYAQQDISIMVAGLAEFVKDKLPSKVELCFVGAEEFKGLSEALHQQIPSSFIVEKKRLPKQEAIQLTIQSDVLFYPAWKNYKGIIGVKPLDYIASGNNILLAPGDDDILDDLIHKTHTGKIANTVSEFVHILNQWYDEWEKSGLIQYEGLKKEIAFYSRKNQAQIMSQKILQL